MWADSQRDGRPAEYRLRKRAKVIAVLVPRRKVFLTHTARLSCSNSANIGERKTCTQCEFAARRIKLGGMSPQNVYIVYQPKRPPNIVQSLVYLHSAPRCSNEAKTRNPSKFAGVPQLASGQPVSAVSGPKFTILWGHVKEILLFKDFVRLSINASVAKI